MKILYLSNSFPPVVSGTSILAARIAEWMSPYHEVGMICPKYSFEGNRNYDFKLFRLPSAPIILRKEFNFILPIPGLIKETFKRFNPDVVHIYDPSPASLILLKLAEKRGIPTIVSHFFYPQFLLEYLRVAPTATGGKPGKLATLILRTIMKQYKGARKIVVLTRMIKDYIGQMTNIPIEVISAGVDYESFSRMTKRQITDICRRYLIPEKPWILYVGRLDQDKNLPTMIRAWGNICQRYRDKILLLVGNGTIRGELEKLARDLGISKQVYFSGTMPETDLPAVYLSRFAQTFYITSKVETQSIATLQALAAGLPVVAANSGALPELVHSGVNGLLCNPDESSDYEKSLITVLSWKDRKKKIRQYSQRLAKRHDFPLSRLLYLRLYKEIIDSHQITP